MSLTLCFCGDLPKMKTEYSSDYSDTTWKYIQCDTCRVRTLGKWYSKGNDCPIFYQEVRDEWNVFIDLALSKNK